MVKLPTINDPLHERGELIVMVASGAHSMAFITTLDFPLLLGEPLAEALLLLDEVCLPMEMLPLPAM